MAKPSKSRPAPGMMPAFYRRYISVMPSFHHDRQKRDEARFTNPKWKPYKKSGNT